jgi:NitT/TauT family transport system ATP-binding protein
MSSHPGRIAADIRVEIPRPRDRRTDEFNSLVDKVFSLIEERA